MRRLVATLSLVVCGLAIWTGLTSGLSRQRAEMGTASAQIALTAEAVRLAPADPVAHRAHAVVLAKAGLTAEAVSEFKKAADLRPADHQLWIELGRLQEQSGNKEAALIAFHEAVRCAPYYAQPRWNLGNLLLSLGRRDEAFAELSRAGGSDPNLFSELLMIAWNQYPGNALAVERAVQPQTPQARIQLAQFLVWRGLPNEALAVFRQTEDVSERDREELITTLIDGKWFNEAYEVWLSEGSIDGTPGTGLAVIDNPGFESGDRFNRKGFGWQSPRDLGEVSITLDNLEPKAGRRSLCLDWKGITNVSVPTLSQLILVESATRYRLSFAARTKDLSTGTPPFIGVLDADSGETLAQTAPLSTGSNPWQDSTLEFSTRGDTRALRIFVQRPRCSETVCPIYGRTWFDSFSLQKLETVVEVVTKNKPSNARGST